MIWILCNEQMPPQEKDVLVYIDHLKSITIARWYYEEGEDYFGNYWNCSEPSHWMQLPKRPDQEREI